MAVTPSSPAAPTPAATAGPRAGPAGRARGGRGGRPPRGATGVLLRVPLPRGAGAPPRLPRTLAKLAPRPPLPQQIPALVERLLGGSKLGVLLVRGQLPPGELGAQFVLGLDQLVD